MEHWLNGTKVLAYELGSLVVKDGIAKSKFKGHPGFGEKITGHVMLTYHQDECWYRNLKIRNETRGIGQVKGPAPQGRPLRSSPYRYSRLAPRAAVKPVGWDGAGMGSETNTGVYRNRR